MYPSYEPHDDCTLCLRVRPKIKYWKTGLDLHFFSIHQHNRCISNTKSCGNNKNIHVCRHVITVQYLCRVVESFDKKFFIYVQGMIINRIAAEVTFQPFRYLIKVFTYLRTPIIIQQESHISKQHFLVTRHNNEQFYPKSTLNILEY